MQPTAIDLLTVDRQGTDGAVWSLAHGGDLDANLVHLGPGGAVGTHVNDDVDVLIVGIDGAGFVTIDSVRQQLRTGIVVVVPKGRARGVEASDGTDVTYLTVHRARSGVHIRH